MNWLDLVLVLIVALSVWQGFRSGFIMSVARIMGILLGLVVALSFYRSAAGYVEQQWQWITKTSTLLYGMLPLPVSVYEQEALTPDIIWEMSQQLPLPEAWYALFIRFPMDNLQGSSFAEALVFLLATFLMEALLFLLVFFLAYTVTMMLGGILAKMFSFGPLSFLGRLGGAGLGLLKGALIVLLLVAFLVPFQFPVAFFGTHGEPGFLAAAAQNSSIVQKAWQIIEQLNISLPGLLPVRAYVFTDIA